MNTTFTTLSSTRGLLLFLLMLLLGSSETWAQTSTNFDVVSIKRYKPLDQAVEYVAMFKVVFSGYIEDNTGRELGESDFRVITTGTATGTFATILTNGNNAYVTVKDMSGTGSVGIEYTGPTKSVYTGGETYEIVDKRPTVLSITRRNEEKLWGGNAYPRYLVIFSEPVTGVDAADFGVALDNTYATIYSVEDANGSNYPEFFDNNRLLGDFAHREGSQYIVMVGPVLGEGTLRLDVNATGTGIADVSGSNPLDGGFTAGESYYFDGVSPAVVSINRQAPATAVSGPGSVTFRVTFSEAVQGVDAADFGLVATGTVAGYGIGTIAAVSASVYDVTVNGITGEGSLRLKIWPGYSRTDLEINRYGSFEAAILILTRFYVIRYGGMATIYDFSSDLLRLTNPLERFDANSTEGETYTISSAPANTSPPVVLNILRGDPAYDSLNVRQGSFVRTGEIIVNFSEPVTGVDAADFNLVLDAGVYTTIYRVDPIDRVYPLGAYITMYPNAWVVVLGRMQGLGNIRVDVKPDATITDYQGNPLTGGFTGVGYHYDAVTPLVRSIRRTDPVPSVVPPGSVTYRITFSEAVKGVDAPDFGFDATGTVAGYSISTITPVSASVYDVTVSGITGEGTLGLKVWPGFTLSDINNAALVSSELSFNPPPLEILIDEKTAINGGVAVIFDFSNGVPIPSPSVFTSTIPFASDPPYTYDNSLEYGFTNGETYTITSTPVAASINPSTAQLNCAAPTVRLTASAGTAYLWSTGATTAAIEVTTAGTYSVTVTNNGATSVASATVTGSTTPPTAGISPGSATLSCSTPSVSLTATGGESYLWEDNSTNAVRTVNAAGTYSVTVTGANGCTASARITVTGNAADGLMTYYADADGDSFGNANSSTSVCSSTPPDGYVTNSTDCDDTRRLYADGDRDGFGAGAVVACGVATNTDCNDADKTVNTPQTYYADADGDGFGNLNSTTKVCSSTPPAGFVANSTDCDDARKLYADGDRDGFGAGVAVACGVTTNTDCNDNNAAITPTTITSQPAGLSVVEKQTASFSVTATGTNLTYQWYFNGTTAAHALKKGTAAVLTLKGAKLSFKETKPTDAGIYYVRATGSCGSVLSVGAKLTVTSNRARVAAGEEGEPSWHLAVQAWPNPTTGRLQVRVTGAGEQPTVTLRLYTLMQRVAGAWTIPLENGEGEQTIDIGKASEGIYILAVEGEQNRVIQKVIKSN